MKKIAIMASGNGSNAENIIQYFRSGEMAEVVLILSNNKDAYVMQRAKNHGILAIVFTAKQMNESNLLIDLLQISHIDYIVLAGFLLKIPESILQLFPDRIINIHPALLPKYGGKGMFGMHVHEKVIEEKETESGITIHYVNEKYDEGQIIFQARCDILPSDTPEMLAQKVHELEYRYFPEVIEKVVLGE